MVDVLPVDQALWGAGWFLAGGALAGLTAQRLLRGCPLTPGAWRCPLPPVSSQVLPCRLGFRPGPWSSGCDVQAAWPAGSAPWVTVGLCVHAACVRAPRKLMPLQGPGGGSYLEVSPLPSSRGGGHVWRCVPCRPGVEGHRRSRLGGQGSRPCVQDGWCCVWAEV